MNAYNTLADHAARKAADPNYFANAPRNLQAAWRKQINDATDFLYANAQAREAMSPAEEDIYLDFMAGGYTVADSDDWLDQSLANAVAVINRHVAWREADPHYYYTSLDITTTLQWFRELSDAVALITCEGAEYMLTDLANDLVCNFESDYVDPYNLMAYYVKRDILTKKAIVPVDYYGVARLVYTQYDSTTCYYLAAGEVTSQCLCHVTSGEVKFKPNFASIVLDFTCKHGLGLAEATNV